MNAAVPSLQVMRKYLRERQTENRVGRTSVGFSSLKSLGALLNRRLALGAHFISSILIMFNTSSKVISFSTRKAVYSAVCEKMILKKT